MNPARKGTCIAAIAQGYVDADRTANGVCIYCKFWPCMCAAPNNSFRRMLRRLNGAETLRRVLAERAAMLR